MEQRNAELDWERSVIATAVTNPASMEEAEELLPVDFTGHNQIVWAEIMALHARDGLDARALINAVRNAPDWDRRSGGIRVEDYFAEVLTFRGTNMRSYVEMVIDRSIRRQLRLAAALIASEADNNQRRLDELLDYAEQRILTLRRSHSGEDLSMADIMGIFIPRMEGMIEGSINPGWVPEIEAVREVVDYLEDEDFLVNAARPGDGKSSWMRYEFYLAAKNHGRSCGILNYENSPIEYARYFLAIETGIDSRKLKNPRYLSGEQRELVRDTAVSIARLPIRVVTTERTVSAAIRAARKMIASSAITLLGLDYIQLLNNGLDNRANDIALTTGVLRAFALDNHVPVIANAQLNRAIETRGGGGNEGAEPQLSDLRESGSIEQDASTVMFPRPMRNPSERILRLFPGNFDDNGVFLAQRPRVVPTFFYVLKNRNGSQGKSLPVAWLKHLDTYQSLDPAYIEEIL